MGLAQDFADMCVQLNAAAAATKAMATESAAAVPILGQEADATAKLAAAQKQLAADTQFAKEQAAGHARAVGDTSTALATMTTQLTLAQGVFFSVTAATDAQNKALENLLKTQGAYTNEVKQTLDVATGWKDYLAGLADAYKTGAINLLQYRTELADFATELRQDFSGATGEARKAIDTMTQAIQAMINAAGAGGGASFDMSPTGQLNRAFNNP